MTRICVYHRYEYPDLKSRLTTYLLKLFPVIMIIDRRPVVGSLYGGETWINDMDIIIGEDEIWVYHLEVEHGAWCRQIQILIIKELKK